MTVATAQRPASLPSHGLQLLTRKEAAQYLGISVGHMAQLASSKRGPPFKLLGRKAMYEMDELASWWRAQEYADRGQK